MMNPINPPREDSGKWISLALAIAVHLLLAAFLIFGLRWQSSPPASLEVELSAPPPPPRMAEVRPAPEPPKPEPKKPEPRPEPPKPQPAPPKPEPKPEPKKLEPKPEIATKAPKPEPKKPEPQPEPKKPEPKKPEPPKPEPKKPEPKKPEPLPEPKKPEPKPEPKKAETKKPEPALEPPSNDYFKEQLARESARTEFERMMQNQAKEAAGARTKAALADYENRIRAKVRGNVLRPPGVTGDPEAVFHVVQLPTGEVLSVRLVRSSGNPALDDAIERAIRRSSPLPLPDNMELFRRELELKFRPMSD